MENKIEFIKALEDLCRKTSALQDIVIEPGNFDKYPINLDSTKFIPYKEGDPDPKVICIHWKDQSWKFGYIQGIEADSCYGILLDAMKCIKKMG